MRGSGRKQVHNWGTPWWLIRAIEARMGKFDVDLCAERWSAKAPAYFSKKGPDVFAWEPAHGVGGLERFWCNMPYDEHPRWMALCRRLGLQGHTVVALPQAGVGTDWWREHVERPEGPPRGVRKGWWALEDEKGRDRGGYVTTYAYDRLLVEVCFPKRIEFLPPPRWKGARGGGSFQNAIVVYRAPAALAEDARQERLW